jgi:zinc/manganese transport system ATP-binding protein
MTEQEEVTGPTATQMPPAAAHVVRLEHAAVEIRGRTLWSEANLDVRAGELVAVLGPNGVGKSTLLQVILGAQPLAAGSVEVLGGSPGMHNDRIGYLPQRRSFDASIRVRGVDLVRLGLTGTRFGVSIPLRRGARERHRHESRRVQEMVDLVGAHAYAQRPIGQLSGGEQQRLLIAQALVSAPSLLLLDEPLESLDLPNQMAVADLVAEICREEGVTVMIVAHDVNPILGKLDRVVYIAGGQVVVGSPEQVINEATLSHLYGTPVEVIRTPRGRLVVVGEPDVAHHHHGPHGEPLDETHAHRHDEHHHDEHHHDVDDARLHDRARRREQRGGPGSA